MRWVVFAVGALSGFAALGCSCDSTVLGLTREGDAGTKPVNATDAAGATDTRPDVYSESSGVRSHSGSRIDVRGFRSGDAETLAPDQPLHDTKQDADCSIVHASDGVLRCLPAGAAVFYTDENCTKPIAAVSTGDAVCGPAPKTFDYALEFFDGSDACTPRRFPAFALGDPVDAPATIYEQSAFGCAVRPDSPYAETFRAASPSPAADWVRFERDITKVTPKLGVSSWVGSDGSRLVTGPVLLPDGTPCTGQTTRGSPTVRCVPSDRLIRSTAPGLFADDACTEGLAARCDAVPPSLIEDTDLSQPSAGPCTESRFPICGPLFRLGHEADHSTIDLVENAVCGVAGEGAILPPWHYYVGGAAVPFGDYPLLGEVFSGNDRLQEITLVSEEGKKLFPEPAVFYDTVARAECRPQDPLLDGRMFCVPSHAFAFTGFAFEDAGCTRGIAMGDLCPAVSVAVEEQHSELGPDDPRSFCPSRLRRITPRGSSTAFVKMIDGTCTANDAVRPLYDIGEPVDPGALFPELDPEPL